MPKRDPHEVLGVRPGASATAIKVAWRRLAREHHPDLTGDDPAASRVATRQMAEINDAYESLRREGVRARVAEAAARSDRRAGGGFEGPAPGTRTGGPPRPRPSRPVTGRVDTSETFRPRNSTTGEAGRGARAGWGSADARARSGSARDSSPSARPSAEPEPEPKREREPPRASHPTGPMERARIHRFRPPPRPTLETAHAIELEFGKFRGHTLGEVAAFEPSYVDWLARTITRDRDLVAAARVIKDDLDRRQVHRRERPERNAAGRPA